MTYTDLKLKLNIQHFDFRLQQFAELLNMTVDEIETLKETDSTEGNYFYGVYSNFMKGQFPSEDTVKHFRRA